MKSQIMSMGAASVLLAIVACGCAAETGTDQQTPAAQTTVKTEHLGSARSAEVYGNPAGYDQPGYDQPAPNTGTPSDYDPNIGNEPGYNPGTGNPYYPDTGYPPSYNPAMGIPPVYNPGTGY